MTRIPELTAGASVSDAIRIVANSLHAAGIESPSIDARALIGGALQLTRAQLLTQAERLLTSREIEAISAMVARRLQREPVSRIVGRREFWKLTLRITPDVLDPRPDTETLVEDALEYLIKSGRRDEKLNILDIGTGSGALLLALLIELPHATGVATDISAAALAVARDNAECNGLSDHSHFIVCSIASALTGPFDIIVSNPPYIPHNEIAKLEPEVREYDPFIALDGGTDGLDAYRALAQEAHRLLAPNGRLFVELGLGQESMVSALFTKAGLAVGRARADLGGIPRSLGASFLPTSTLAKPLP